ncbi:cobalamin biosynthesis protein [Antrihabitans stalagmiti]|uniref:cobalamin biosynthesis protein n=1 Tax=Antrihabitans stalagmiti TaxID=2799499 RepID=UPI0027DDFED8|nr:cobalamin biosynthesis protein [Antrihabitans stalagmiti]
MAADLVVGLGLRPSTEAAAILDAIAVAVGDEPIRCLATMDRRAADLGLRTAAATLGVFIVAFDPGELAEVDVESPSTRVQDALGTPSVAEAAALLASGHGQLVVAKRVVNGVVVAAARNV